MTARAAAAVEILRSTLATIDSLDPEEQDHIIGALVADLRARRPVAVSCLSTLPPPGEVIRDPRTVQP